MEAAQAARHIWATVEANKQASISIAVPGVDPNDKNIRVLNLMQACANLRPLIEHERALEMVRTVVGDDFIISSFTANIARPGSGSMRVHSDQSFVAPQPWLEPLSVNIIWCLTDVYGANGATLFVPGSHRWRRQSDILDNIAKRLQPFEAKAGSIIVMEGRLWHTSGVNITETEDRVCVFGHYSVSYLRPRVNWNVALSPDVQKSMLPQLREWLGLDLLPNVPKSFKLEDGLKAFSAATLGDEDAKSLQPAE